MGTKPYLLCVDANGNEVFFPVEYTNLGKPRLSESQQEGMPFFAYGSLVELRKLLNRIKEV